MKFDINKIFFPYSVTNRLRTATREKNTTNGTGYNYAISFVRLLRKALISNNTRTNFTTVNSVVVDNNGSLSQAEQLDNFSNVILIDPQTFNSSTIMSKADDNQIVTLKNVNEENDLIIFPSSGDTVNGSADSTTLAAGSTMEVVALDRNWNTL